MIRRIPPARYCFARTITILLMMGAGVPVWTTAAIGTPARAGTRASAAAPTRVTGRHPVHVSNTQVELSRDERRFTVTVRMFTDDLEDALRAGGSPVSISTAPSAAVDSALSGYLRERVQFGLDGRAAVPGRVTGHGQEGDATLVFLEVPLTAVPTRVSIVQRVLLDRFDDQTNLVHVRAGTVRRSALLRRGSERAEFSLSP